MLEVSYPLIMISSSSEILSWITSAASPNILASKVSSPSIFDKEVRKVAPVALAILLRSAFLTLRTPMAPASTKYFKQRSSIPPLAKMTFTPVERIFWIRSLVISSSLLWMASNLSGSVIRIWKLETFSIGLIVIHLNNIGALLWNHLSTFYDSILLSAVILKSGYWYLHILNVSWTHKLFI